MNERARELGLDSTSYANPIGFDDPLNYSTARDLAALAVKLLRRPRFARTVDTPVAELDSGARPRVIDNRNTLVASYPFVSGVKTGHTQQAGYVLIGAAKGAGGAKVVSVVMGEPSEAARDAETLALLRWGLERFKRVRVLDPRRTMGRAAIEYRDEEVDLVPARGAVLTLREGERVRRRVRAPEEVEGPLAAGERVGSVSVFVDGARRRRVALVTATEVPEAGTLRVLLSDLGVPLTVVLVLAILLGAALVALRMRVRLQAGPKMIITVTLNAAIDKTLAVPNFRLGRRHRAVEQTAMAGGKGVNVARALRALGQPVIATGIAGGPTGTRIVEHLTEEGVLNDFVRIREESRTSTAVVDPTSGEQTEINERGPHVSEGELELFVDKLLYLAKGAAVCVFAGSLPRGVDAGLYGRLIEEMRRLGVSTLLDSEGEPLLIATRKGPDVVSPNEIEAEGLVGHEFSDEDDRRRALGEMVEMGAREGIMTLADGCLAVLGDSSERCLYRATLEPLEPVSSVGSGDAFLAGFVAARYGGLNTEECLRFAVACGAESTQHFGAGQVDQREVERLLAEVRVEALEAPAIEVP